MLLTGNGDESRSEYTLLNQKINVTQQLMEMVNCERKKKRRYERSNGVRLRPYGYGKREPDIPKLLSYRSSITGHRLPACSSCLYSDNTEALVAIFVEK